MWNRALTGGVLYRKEYYSKALGCDLNAMRYDDTLPTPAVLRWWLSGKRKKSRLKWALFMDGNCINSAMNQLSNTRISGTCKWVLNACVCARTVVDVSGDKRRGERGERGERDGTGRDDSSPLTMDTLCYRRVLCIMREISQYTTRYVHEIRTGEGEEEGGKSFV